MEILSFIQEIKRKNADYFKVWMDILLRYEVEESFLPLNTPTWIKKTQYYRAIEFGLSIWPKHIKEYATKRTRLGIYIEKIAQGTDNPKAIDSQPIPSISSIVPSAVDTAPQQSKKKAKPSKESSNEYPDEVFNQIISYLNSCAGKNYRLDTKSTRSIIASRLKEGYTIDDFKYVIEIKSRKWLGTAMETFLRPETLFSNKFEGYLNENMPAPADNSNIRKTYDQLSEVERLRSTT